MNGRSLAALAALTTLALVAGCVAPNDFLSASSTRSEITAMQDRDLADNAAQAWSPGAQLVSVFAIELAIAEKNSSWPADPHVGNAKAPAWVYAYQAADGNGTKAFRVTANGRVTPENETDAMGDMSSITDAVAPIADSWKIDSDKALASALKNESFKSALKGGNLTLAEGVARMSDMNATCYYFAAVGMSGMAIALVDATTGTLASVKSFDMPKMDFGMGSMGSYASWGQPLNEQGKGSVTEAKPKMEFPFRVGNAQPAKFTFSSSPSLPTDQARWQIVGPDGKAIKTANNGGSMMRGGGSQSTTVTIPSPGDYKVVVTYGSAAPDPLGLGSVDFSWTLKAAGATPSG